MLLGPFNRIGSRLPAFEGLAQRPSPEAPCWGIARAGLYKALSAQGNPSFETAAKIVGAFGMWLSAQAA
jgi:DNA-binding phage protein